MSGKVGVDYRYYFVVRQGNGAPRLGLVTGDFDVEIRNPANAASQGTPVAIVEVGDGLYFFDIDNVFTTTGGAGVYGLAIEITSAPLDTVGDHIPFFVRNVDDVAQPGDAMDLVADAVDAAAVATSGAQEIRDEILTDATRFPGAAITELRLAELDPANVPADIDAILVDTGTDIPARFDGVEGAGFVSATDSLEASQAEHDATQAAIGALPTVAQIADGVLLEDVTDHVGTANSLAQFLDRLLGFAGQSTVLRDGRPNASDTVKPDYDSKGLMLEGRLRTFRTATDRGNATPGNAAVETGELYRQLVSATSATPGLADAYNSDRAL